jgi:uncharacterized DUF497 family protein
LALEFEWNPQKAASNRAKHGVSFEEAATVFRDALGRIVADPRHSADEERLVLLGASKDGHLLAVMFVDRGERVRGSSSVRGGPRAMSEKIMKRPRVKSGLKGPPGADEILPEYDFSKASPNKHASRYATGSSVVVLEPDVAAAFPTSVEANDALRALAAIIKKHRPERRRSRRNS